MSKLTDEETQRVVAMYWGQNILRYYDDNELYPVNAHNAECRFLYLLLTPLSKITDEHAIELSKMLMMNQENNSSKIRISVAKEMAQSLYDLPYYFREQLIIWGYSVPLYFGIDHPANGMDAITLGIALDKTTLQCTSSS